MLCSDLDNSHVLGPGAFFLQQWEDFLLPNHLENSPFTHATTPNFHGLTLRDKVDFATTKLSEP